MAWWGKLLGGAFGFMLGGPLGAILGVALGHNVDTGLDRAARLPPGGEGVHGRERTQTAFFTATFSVMGHIAKADGRVTPDEIKLAGDVMAHMALPPDLTRLAQRLFSEGKSPQFPLDAVLDQFRAECHDDPHLLRVFLELQVQAAYADGNIHAQERRVLLHVCDRLGLHQRELDHAEAVVRAERGHYQDRFRAPGADTRSSIHDAYAILGVRADTPDAEVTRAYRRLMSENHPDKLVSKGLPEEMMQVATERTQEIQLAYERIKEARGL